MVRKLLISFIIMSCSVTSIKSTSYVSKGDEVVKEDVILNKYGSIKSFKLNRGFGFRNALTDVQMDSVINYCNQHCRFNPNIVITTIYRESCFNPNIKSKTGGNDLGLGQFVNCAINYHKLNRDSITDYMYSVKAIIMRYHDIQKVLKPKSDKLLIAAYGNYNRVRINDTLAINKSYNLFVKKQIELSHYIIKK